MKRFVVIYVLPGLLLSGWAVLPLIRGTKTLYLRDVFNTHLEKKWFQAEAMRAGYLPLVDPYRDGGQPHLGNPNTVPLYPDNLLFLISPTLWAFNAHFWLHWLLAQLTFFWLARAWGLGREAAWAAAVCFALSGYFLSNLSFYNLVAGTAWTPALVAAMLYLAGSGAGWGSFVACGLIWTLLLLAGDPMSCLAALILGTTAVIFRWGLRVAGWRRLGLALALGTLVAAPQWVEFLRILPLSFRGHLGYSEAAATAASWHPAAVLEWLLPLFFGGPDLSFWGQRFHGGDLPLFPTLYPGLLVLVLILGSGRPTSWAARWAVTMVGLGLFLALGEHNPLVGWLLRIPGMDLLRLPVKLWLLVAVGSALLAGVGFERLILRARTRLVWKLVAGLAVGYAALWLALGGASASAPAWLGALIDEALSGQGLERERLRWAGLCLLSILHLLGLGLVCQVTRRRAPWGGALLLVLHVSTQLFLLRPVLATDEAAVYLEPPELLEQVPAEAVVAHGQANSLFGPVEIPFDAYPDARLLWLQRQVFQELYPMAGSLWGRRYEFSQSAEGLDAFLTRAVGQSFRRLSDAARLRLLAAAGVDLLLLGRPVHPEVGELASLRHRRPSPLGEIRVYGVEHRAAAVQFVGRVLRAPHLNAALTWMTAEDFDARTTAVLPQGGPSLDGPGGEVTVLESGPEALAIQVTAPAAGVLVVQRAFLPIYRATADGEPVALVAANIHRLGIELPAGSHYVRVWIDRRPLALSVALSALSALALLALGSRRRLRPRDC